MSTILTPQEARVLGVLIEKHLSTPDHYPLTLNSTTVACNQKSNRSPVVKYSEVDVQEAVDSLHRKHLVGRSMGSGSRVTKYRHTLGETWRLQRPELAVLGSLLLRGAQTTGEIRTRCTRMNEFESLEEVASVVENLVARDEPLVAHLPRQPGQKEGRCAHLLCGEPDPQSTDSDSADAAAPGSLAEEVLELRDRIDALESAFADFRRQFE